jgi:hypothetical protein
MTGHAVPIVDAATNPKTPTPKFRDTNMSNLKNHFTSKLVSVTQVATKGRYVYLATFDNGASSVIRTSNRAYLSVTQIRCDNHFVRDENGEYHKVDRTDFLFSAKDVPALGKAEQHRVVATVKVNAGAPAPAAQADALDRPMILGDWKE